MGDGKRFSAPGTGWAMALAAIGAQLEGRRMRGGLQVLLSGGLARPFMLPAVDGIDTREEALQVAAASAPDITAMDGACAVWLDQWQPGTACLAAAVEQELIDALQAFAKTHGVRLRSARPWWDVGLNEARARNDTVGMVALEDEDALLVLVSAAERGAWAEAFCYSPLLDAAQRVGTESRIALSAGLSTAEVARATWMTQPMDHASSEAELGRVIWANGTGT